MLLREGAEASRQEHSMEDRHNKQDGYSQMLSLLLEATSGFHSSFSILKALVKGTPKCLAHRVFWACRAWQAGDRLGKVVQSDRGMES